MYAGHFASALLFQAYFPHVNSFLLTIGVGLLDIVFGCLAYFNLEGITLNPNGGFLGADLHCSYSHSLLGSLIISSLWGCLGINNNTFLPLFLSSFCHFLLDWIVHNRDMELYPKSNIFVGGREYWYRYPQQSYYFELILCILCSTELIRKVDGSFSFSIHSIFLILSISYIFYLHYQRRPAIHGQLAKMLEKMVKETERPDLIKIFLIKFILPVTILGTLLHFSIRY